MNISHLIGKKVSVAHFGPSGTETLFWGKLHKSVDGSFIVFADSFLMSLLKRLFFNAKDSCIKFPWTAVSACHGNLICIVDMTEDQTLALAEKYGIITEEEKETLKQNK